MLWCAISKTDMTEHYITHDDTSTEDEYKIFSSTIYSLILSVNPFEVVFHKTGQYHAALFQSDNTWSACFQLGIPEVAARFCSLQSPLTWHVRLLLLGLIEKQVFCRLLHLVTDPKVILCVDIASTSKKTVQNKVKSPKCWLFLLFCQHCVFIYIYKTSNVCEP